MVCDVRFNFILKNMFLNAKAKIVSWNQKMDSGSKPVNILGADAPP